MSLVPSSCLLFLSHPRITRRSLRIPGLASTLPACLAFDSLDVHSPMACRSWDGVTRQLSPFQNDDDRTRNASPPKSPNRSYGERMLNIRSPMGLVTFVIPSSPIPRGDALLKPSRLWGRPRESSLTPPTPKHSPSLPYHIKVQRRIESYSLLAYRATYSPIVAPFSLLLWYFVQGKAHPPGGTRWRAARGTIDTT